MKVAPTMQSQPAGQLPDQMSHMSLGGAPHMRPGGPMGAPFPGAPPQGSFPPQVGGSVNAGGQFPPRPGIAGGPGVPHAMNGVHPAEPSMPNQMMPGAPQQRQPGAPAQHSIQSPTVPSQMMPGAPPQRHPAAIAQHSIQSPTVPSQMMPGASPQRHPAAVAQHSIQSPTQAGFPSTVGHGMPPASAQPPRQAGIPPQGMQPIHPMPQTGLPPHQQPPQSGLPPHQQPPQSSLPPHQQPPQSGLPPHQQPPQSGLPPHQQPPQSGLPPHQQHPQSGLPPHQQHPQHPSQTGLPPHQQPLTQQLPPQAGAPPLSQPGSYMNGVPAPHPGMGHGPMVPNAAVQPGMRPPAGQFSSQPPSAMGYAQPSGLPGPPLNKGYPPAPATGMPPLPQTGSYINGISGAPPRPGMGQGPLPPGAGQMIGLQTGMQPGIPAGIPGGMPPAPGQYPPQPAMGYQPGMQSPKGFPPAGTVGPQPMGYAPQGGMYPQQAQQQQQQQRRLDPANMPSPIQVMQEDQTNKGGIFITNQKGQAPPLVTTDFICQDQGNASPRYIRATMYNVPITMDIMKQVKVPVGLIISPLAKTAPQELPPPVVNFGEMGPVRCLRCKAYMCPYMQFIDGGRRFHCLFCKATTEVPPDYFQHLDHTGQRVDRYDRPELVLGSYEFVATKEYCRNSTFPNPPALIFLIDVSYNNIKSGMIHLLCAHMKQLLKSLPVDSAVGADKTKMRVGFITYNNTVHFYNIKSCLAQPQMMVVGDVQDMFMPLLDGFLCDAEESEAVIDSLMEQIPAMFGETRETETVLAPAIQAGMEALKAADCAGKLLVLHSSLPIAEAPGKLKNRDDRKLLATEKEKTILTPQNNIYNNLGQECVGVGCSVDLFIFNNSYIDIATIGQVARLTGGEVYKYTYFQADVDGERLISDLQKNIGRPIAFDAVMRVRTSTGVRATDFYGHFYMSNTTDVELASVDCDKGIAVEVKHDDKLTEEDGVYIQIALLYTSCSGQRRLRIHNLSLKTCAQMADMFRTCDLDSIINFFSKQACYRLLEHTPKQVKDNLISLCAQTLACYRKNCASPSSAGQLILPETMKLLPLYLNCLLRSDALSGGSDMTVDDRSFVMQAVMTMDVPSSVAFFYPRLIPLHDVDTDSHESPFLVRCSVENLQENGVYLLENGIHMFLWIGLAVSVEWLQGVFGVASIAQVDVERPSLPDLDTVLSKRVRQVIADQRAKRHRCMRLTIVRQRDKLEMVMKHFLVEDRGLDNSPSYVDFLCQMHKEIRTLLE